MYNIVLEQIQYINWIRLEIRSQGNKGVSPYNGN